MVPEHNVATPQGDCLGAARGNASAVPHAPRINLADDGVRLPDTGRIVAQPGHSSLGRQRARKDWYHVFAAAQDAEALLQVIASLELRHLRHADVCNALVRLSKLWRGSAPRDQVRLQYHGAFALLHSALQKLGDRMSSTQLCSSLMSLAWLKQRCSQQVLLPCKARLLELLPRMHTDDICHAAWALAKLGFADTLPPEPPAAPSTGDQRDHPPDGARRLTMSTIEALCADAVARNWIGDLPAQQLSGLLWSLGKFVQNVEVLRGSAPETPQPVRVGDQQHSASNLHPDSGSVLEYAPLGAALDTTACESQGHAVSECWALVGDSLSEPGFLQTFSPQHTSNTLWGCARLGIPLARHVMSALITHVVTQAGQCKPQALSNIAVALAKYGVQDSPTPRSPNPSSAAASNVSPNSAAVFSHLAAAAVPQLEAAQPQELSNLLGACASANCRHRPLLAASEKYVEQRLGQLGPRDMAELLSSYATLGWVPEGDVLRLMSDRSVALVRRMAPYQAVTLLHSLAKLGAAPTALLREVDAMFEQGDGMAIASQQPRDSQQPCHASQLAAPELAKLLWAFARCGHIPSTQFLCNAEDALEAALTSQQPQTISTILWALATLDIRSTALLARVAPSVASSLGAMTAQALSMTLWAYAKLSAADAHSSSSTFNAADSELLHAASRGKAAANRAEQPATSAPFARSSDHGDGAMPAPIGWAMGKGTDHSFLPTAKPEASRGPLPRFSFSGPAGAVRYYWRRSACPSWAYIVFRTAVQQLLESPARLRELDRQALPVVLWSLSAVQHQPGARLLGQLADLAIERLPEYNAQVQLVTLSN